MPKTIIFPYPFKEQCDMALCSRPKEYTIAVEGSHPSLFFGICKHHMESLLDAIIEHQELGPMMAGKLIDATSEKENAFQEDTNSQTDAKKEADSPVDTDPTDQPNRDDESRKPKQQEIIQDKKTQNKRNQDKNTAICPYCNKTFNAGELRDHMKKCNGGEHC
jgi:hypothetical protein